MPRGRCAPIYSWLGNRPGNDHRPVAGKVGGKDHCANGMRPPATVIYPHARLLPPCSVKANGIANVPGSIARRADRHRQCPHRSPWKTPNPASCYGPGLRSAALRYSYDQQRQYLRMSLSSSGACSGCLFDFNFGLKSTLTSSRRILQLHLTQQEPWALQS